MSKKSPHAATPAFKVVEDAGIEHRVYTFEAGTDHFGDHAAAALDVEPERVLKTLVIDLTAGKGPKRKLAVCVIPTLSLIHISEPTRRTERSRMPSSA